MPPLFSLLSLLISFGLSPSVFCSPAALRHIQMFFRHGQRTPTTFLYFPNENVSAFPASNFAFDLGEMTKEGMRQEFDLGQNVRSLYDTFLGESYRSREIAALSGRDNRTIASAQLLLAGLFPPSGDQIWNGNLLWQPIPVETLPILDHASFGLFDDCPAESWRIANSAEYAQISNGFEPLFEELSAKTGLNISSLEILQKVTDAIVTRSNLSDFLPLPKWAASDAYLRKIAQKRLEMHEQVIDLFLDSLGGWHFDQLIGRMDDAVNNRSRQKAVFYSAHDTNILTIGRYLNISPINDTFFGYAGFIVFELYQNNTEHFVEVKSHPQPNGTLSRLVLPQCGHPCPLSVFRSLRPRLSTPQWMSRCVGTSPGDCSLYGSILGVLTILLILLVALFGSVLWSCQNYKKRFEKALEEEREPLLIRKKKVPSEQTVIN